MKAATLRFDSLALGSLMDVIGEKNAAKAVTVQKIEIFKAAYRNRGIKPHSINSYLRHLQAEFNTALE